jgi:hypothetical protein
MSPGRAGTPAPFGMIQGAGIPVLPAVTAAAFKQHTGGQKRGVLPLFGVRATFKQYAKGAKLQRHSPQANGAALSVITVALGVITSALKQHTSE